MVIDSGNGSCVEGAMTALVTPFRDGEVDWPCLDRLVERQIDGSIDCLVVAGTTGETPTLTAEERDRIVAAVIARAGGRCPVMVGTGASSTAEAVRRSKDAARAGANAALVVAPCYNRPTPEGLFRHFAAVAEAVDLPIVLYDVPARTGVAITVDVVVRLRERFDNIVAIKDASGGVDHVTELLSRCDIMVLCGDDSLTWPFLSLGATGVISVIANLVPASVKSLVTAAAEGNMTVGRQVHRKLFDLAAGLSGYGPNPIPIKTAMAIAGLVQEEFRLPLCPLDADARAAIGRIVRRHEIPEFASV